MGHLEQYMWGKYILPRILLQGQRGNSSDVHAA